MVAVGHEVILYGKPKEHGGRLIIDHPEFEVVTDGARNSMHLERIVPVYRNVSGIAQRRLREVIYAVLENLDGASVPELCGLGTGLSRGTRPSRRCIFRTRWRRRRRRGARLRWRSFSCCSCGCCGGAQRHRAHAGRAQGQRTALLKAFYESLPFDLTGAQKRSVKEIVADMRSPRPMNRLLQGDVGSGKTFVAMCAMLLAVDSGAQAALMAPTQILAEQHYLTFRKWLEPLGVRLALVTGAKQERAHLEIEGEAQIVIGTHALLYDNVAFSRPRAGGDRRAAQVRGGAAGAADPAGRDAGRAGDDGHADPAHPDADDLRRPRCVGARRAAGGAREDRHRRCGRSRR